MAYRDIPNIDTLGETGDIDAPVGSREWAIAVRGELSVCLTDEASNRGRIKHLTELLQESRGYERLSDVRGRRFISWQSFCVAPAPWGLNYPPALLKAIIDEHNQPAALRVEQAAERTSGETLSPGDNQYTQVVSGILPLPKRADENGISRATQARLDYLARNAPELHEAVKRGEIGARPAYEQARGKKTITVPLDTKAAAATIVRHFDRAQVMEIIAALAIAMDA